MTTSSSRVDRHLVRLLAILLLLCFTVPLAVSTAAAPRSAPDSARLLGTVTSRVTGKALVKAQVTIREVNSRYPKEAVWETFGRGDFYIGGVDSGDYFICASGIPGYVNTCYGGLTPIPVRIRNSETIEGINIAMETAVQFSGYVYEADGSPATYAKVTVQNLGDNLTKSVYVDSFGFFAFELLTPGAYTAKAEKSGYLPDTRPSVDALEDIEIFSLPRPNNAADVSFTLDRAGSIAGVVTNQSTGAWLAGVSVWLYPAGGAPDDERKTTTAANGSYSFSNIPPGSYLLKAETANMATGYYPNAYSAENATPLNIVNGANLRNINIGLAPSAKILGKVTRASDGTTIEASVTLLSLDGKPLMTGWRTMTGGYVLGGSDPYNPGYPEQKIPPGDYLLHVKTNGSLASVYYPNSAAIEAATPIHVEAGQQLTAVNFALGAAGGSISGRIMANDSDTLYGGCIVEAIDSAGVVVSTYEIGNYIVGALFQLKGLPVGQFRLHIGSGYRRLESYYPHASTLETAEPITIGAAEDVTDKNITVDRATFVTGRLFAGGSGTTLENMRGVATFKNIADGREYVTDETDIFTINNLPPGDYLASAHGTLGPMEFATEYYVDAMTPNEAQIVHAVAGQALSLIFRLDRLVRLNAGPNYSDSAYIYSTNGDDYWDGVWYVTTSNLVSMVVPAGATASPTDYRLQQLTYTPTLPADFRPLGPYYQITASTHTGEPVTRLLKPYTYSVDFKAADFPNIPRQRLMLLVLDPLTQEWRLQTFALDPVRMRLTAELSQVGVIAQAEYTGPLQYTYITEVFKP